MELLFALIAVAVVLAIVISRLAAKRQTAQAFKTIAEAEVEANNSDDAAVRATPSLIETPAPPTATKERGEALLAQFDSVLSFADATAWDAEAGKVLEAIEAYQRSCETLKADADKAALRYEATTTDGRDQQFRVARKTRQSAAEAVAQGKLLSGLATQLAERMEMTPNSKAAQSDLLRDLRALKKELELQAREARLAIGEVRQAERVAIIETEPTVLGETKYSLQRSVEERRQIRRRAEAKVRPNETAITALQRQVIALERRMAWVERFRE